MKWGKQRLDRAGKDWELMYQTMKLHLPNDSGVTPVENRFIDLYMPSANGEFVKLYLYLLRCAYSGRDLSVSSIADFFDHTEKDVRRALAYWEKLSLLQLQYDEDGNITDLYFSTEASSSVSGTDSAVGPDVQPAAEPAEEETLAPAVPSRRLPSARTMSAARRRQLQEQEEIRQLIFVQQQYLGRPVTSQEVSNILYFYDKLHFSTELIDYLIEYCASKGNPGARYMEKVAQGWYLDGVSTVEEARIASAGHQKEYHAILRSLGLGGRFPAPAEITYMDRWLGVYGFSLPIITQACDRTIRTTHQASFDYVDGILKSWLENNVHTLEDIDALDLDFQKKKLQSAENTKPERARRKTGSRGKQGAGAFSDMKQREYDWADLEKQLLQAQQAN